MGCRFHPLAKPKKCFHCNPKKVFDKPNPNPFGHRPPQPVQDTKKKNIGQKVELAPRNKEEGAPFRPDFLGPFGAYPSV